MDEITGAEDGWWATLYDAHLATILLERDEPPEATLAFLEEALRLSPGARLYDQCCGIGSLALPLAARGFEVIGCDLVPEYIERARAGAGDLRATFHAADAFELVPDRPCDAAFNWWTGFGYARDDATNLEMLRRAFESLRPGGRFALDTMNVPGLLRGFRPEVTLEKRGIVLERLSRLDVRAGLIHKLWRYTLPSGERVEHRSTVRLHTPWELGALLREAGFGEVRLYGDVDGSPLELDSPRCIAVATREAR